MAVTLDRQMGEGENFAEIGHGLSDEQGRVASLHAGPKLELGVYRLRFDTGSYFRAQGMRSFYPDVRVVFVVDAPDEHYHVPLLLSPFGYSTYRGS
jgi:5-hydroxyisourate hydrolase